MIVKTREIKTVAVLLCALMIVTGGCNAISSLIGGGGSGGTRATAMWADVPAVDGATQVNADIPLPMRLGIKAFVTAAANSDSSSSGSKNNAKLDNFDFIAYTTTKSPDEVKAFYTNELMQAQGWNTKDQPGCSGSTGSQSIGGAFCLFGHEDGAKKSVLIIVAVSDEKTKETQLWYARFDGVSLTSK